MEDAETKVRELFREVLRARSLRDDNIEVKPLSSGGANYTSALFAASQAQGSDEHNGSEITNNEDCLSIFAKVAIIGEKMRKVMNADTLFDTEAIIYKELVPEYVRIQSERNVDIFKFPEMFACDLTRGSETLLLEDLTKTGFRVPSRHNSAEWRFAAAAIGKLAVFHALSFAFEKHNPEKFQSIADRVQFKYTDNDSGKDVWTKIIGNAVQVVKDEHKERVVKLLSVMKEEYPKFRQPINKTVLIHGDYRTSNLLFKDTGENVEIMVVDYQTVITGSPAADVLYFIFLGTNQEFRKEYYHRLLEHYYQELASAASMLGVDLTEEYPREMFDSEIKECTPNALRFSAIILPLVTVDEAAAPAIDGEADVSNFAISPNQAFAERFRGLVDDCVEWGVL